MPVILSFPFRNFPLYICKFAVIVRLSREISLYGKICFFPNANPLSHTVSQRCEFSDFSIGFLPSRIEYRSYAGPLKYFFHDPRILCNVSFSDIFSFPNRGRALFFPVLRAVENFYRIYSLKKNAVALLDTVSESLKKNLKTGLFEASREIHDECFFFVLLSNRDIRIIGGEKSLCVCMYNVWGMCEVARRLLSFVRCWQCWERHEV